MNHSISQTLLHQLRQYLNIIQRSRHHHDSGEMNAHHGQGRIIFLLLENEGISQKELSEYLYVGKSTTAKAVKNLVKNHYVEVKKDEHDKRVHRLYLTKKGKVNGSYSLYSFDNSPDCENEGYIRFSDSTANKMGIFNADGKIVIPAEYSNLSKVQNGMIIALKDAEKQHSGDDKANKKVRS